MRLLSQIEEWRLVIPQSYNRFKRILESFLPTANKQRILIVDDIDADGFGSAKIARSKLAKLFPNCSIYINTQHGFTDLEYAKRFDIIFILDSSSNLLETYKDLGQVFILDHHEYDHSQVCPENVCFINSKDTPELASISAGMLTYIVLTQFLKDQGIEDDSLFDIACMTLYSDIVPLDDYVQSCLFKFMQMKEFSSLLTSLNIYKDSINKNTLAYTIIPLINYTRRLGDVDTLQMLYGDHEELAVRNLLDNRKKSKMILDIIKKLGQIGYRNVPTANFSFCDISFAVDSLPHLSVANFKGVYANKLQEETGLPALVGYKANGEMFFSVRSSEIDSLSFFESHPTEGGGHKSACGFKCSVDDLPQVLTKYDTYVKTVEREKTYAILLNSVADLDLFNLMDLAIYNEFRYSNRKPIILKVIGVDTKDLLNIDLVRYKYTIGNYNFLSYKPLITEGKVDITIVPTLVSYTVGMRKLVTVMEQSKKSKEEIHEQQ